MVSLATNPDAVVALLSAACARRLTTADKIREALDARGRCKWRMLASRALSDIADGVQSPLEARYLRDVERQHRLPRGTRQSLAIGSHGERIYRDVHYAEHGVTVELDGLAYHPIETRALDMRRDNASSLQGDVILHFGWSDVTTRTCATAAQVATVLKLRGWTGAAARCGPRCVIR